MATYRVTIDRDECISCAACWGSCPEFYEENEEDGLSQVLEEYRVGGDPAVGTAPSDLAECVREGAESCPVEIIHVTEHD